MENYIKLLNAVKQLPVVNDAAERGLKVLTECRTNTFPKTVEQKQYLLNKQKRIYLLKN